MPSNAHYISARHRTDLAFRLIDHRMGIDAQVFRLAGLFAIQNPKPLDRAKYHDICSAYIHHLREACTLEEYGALQGWDTKLWQPAAPSALADGKYHDLRRFK